MQPVVVKRSAALGDILLVEPLLRQLISNGEQTYLLTNRKYAELLSPTPRLSEVLLCRTSVPYRSRLIDLDNSYEQELVEYITEAYFHKAGMKPQVDLQPQLYIDCSSGFEDRKYAVLDIGYPGCRQFYKKGWQQVIDALREKGLEVFLIGDRYWGHYAGVVDLRRGLKKQSVSELAAVIRDCNYFIGIDSGPLHIARAYGKPGLGLYCAYANVSLREFAGNRIVSYVCECRKGEQGLHLKCLKGLPLGFIEKEVSLL